MSEDMAAAPAIPLEHLFHFWRNVASILEWHESLNAMKISRRCNLDANDLLHP
jgi:hypothetical protein